MLSGLLLAPPALALLLLVPCPWSALLVRGVLLGGTAIRARTAWSIAAGRAAMGEQWLSPALILGGVAVFTLASALVFRQKRLARLCGGEGR